MEEEGLFISSQPIVESIEDVSSQPSTPKTPKSRKKSKKSPNKQVDSLFELVKEGGAISLARDKWEKKYTKDKFSAITELINFVIESCGCPNYVTVAQVKNGEDIQQLISLIIAPDYLMSAQTDYPIIMKKGELKGYKDRYIEFWNGFIAKCPEKILYDGIFIDVLNQWLSSFSNSSARPFRHTATLAGLEIISALITNANRAQKQYKQSHRQLNAEKKKTTSPAHPRIKQLTETTSELQEHINQLEEMMDEFFLGIFFRRYRDVITEIRVECVNYLGKWIMEYPTRFLGDEYLRYIGWTLNDKAPEVRESSLEALIPLFENKDIYLHLENFTQRFKARVVEMSKDVTSHVGAIAIEVATVMARLDSLEEDDKSSLYELITNESGVIRQEVASFVKEQRFDQLIDNKKLKESELPLEELRSLLEFISESKIPDLPNYVVDAFWGKLDSLVNWTAMTDLLTSEDPRRTLTDSQQTLLVRIINVSAKKLRGVSICPKSKEGHEKKQKIKKDSAKQAQESLTKHFIKALPQLLSNFRGDTEKITELVELPQFVSLEFYTTERHKRYFGEWIKNIHELFMSHTDESVLESIAKTIHHLSTSDYPLKTEFDSGLTTLIREVIDQMRDAFQNGEETSQVASIRRAQHLFKRISPLSQYATIGTELADILDSDEYSEGILSSACYLMFQYLLWAFATLPIGEEALVEIESLATKQTSLVNRLIKFLDSKSGKLKETGFLLTCDTLVLFTPKLRGTALESLMFHFPDDLPFDRFSVKLTEVFDDLLESNADDEEAIFRIVTAFMKPVAFELVKPLTAAPSLLSLYTYSNKALVDHIKLVLSKIREQRNIKESSIVFSALQRKYERYRNADDRESALENFSELSQALAASYTSPKMSDESLTILHEISESSIKYFMINTKERAKFLSNGSIHFLQRLAPEHASRCLDLCKEEITETSPASDYFRKLVTISKGKSHTSPKPKKIKTASKKSNKPLARNLNDELEEATSGKGKRKAGEKKAKGKKKAKWDTSDESSSSKGSDRSQDAEDIDEFSSEDQSTKRHSKSKSPQTKANKTKKIASSSSKKVEEDDEEPLATRTPNRSKRKNDSQERESPKSRRV